MSKLTISASDVRLPERIGETVRKLCAAGYCRAGTYDVGSWEVLRAKGLGRDDLGAGLGSLPTTIAPQRQQLLAIFDGTPQSIRLTLYCDLEG